MRESAAILLNSHEPGQDPRPSKHWQEMMDSYAPSDQPQPPVSTINHHIVAIDCRYQYHVLPAGTGRAMTSFSVCAYSKPFAPRRRDADDAADDDELIQLIQYFSFSPAPCNVSIPSERQKVKHCTATRSPVIP